MKTKSQARYLIKRLEKELFENPNNSALFDRIQQLRNKYEVHKYHDNLGLNDIEKNIASLQSKITFTLKQIQQEYAIKKALEEKNVNKNDAIYKNCLYRMFELHKKQFENKSKLRNLYEECRKYVFYNR